MNVFIEILNDFKFYFNPKTKSGKKHSLILLAVLLLSFGTYKLFFTDKEAPAETLTTLPQVTVLSVAELGAAASFDTIGKVEAVSEANLQTESGGRVTSVSVKIGDTVGAGAVLATIENSAQRAQLVQAQGSYEAALAASAQSGVGVGEASTALTSAKNNAVNTYRSAYSTVNGAIYSNMDSFFSNPNGSVPGLKIDGAGQTQFLNSERVAFQSILPTWQQRSSAITTTSNLDAELGYAKTQTERTIAMVDTFITLFNQSGSVGGYTEVELQTLSANFSALKSSLIGTRSSLDAALAGIASAEDAATRAQLAASGGTVSASDAQVKIALGSLQAAQSNYQKTIIRTPIQGVVNAFYLNAGDFVAPGQPAGIVANNNGLQIKTFINEADSASLNVGDTVTIEGGASGVITAKAAALDPTNGKVAVVVGVNPDSGLTNGATVKVTFAQLSVKTEVDKILVPLSALKITSSGTFVFTLGENNTLVAVPVTQGQLFGENVEIVSGITRESRIVTDARGLKEGQSVTVGN
jgi:multidrug efflux pump subunit AcrA (membrane-fusion protein)